MGRHGYTDDYHDQQALAMYRGQVASAIRGKRGQAMLRDLRDALDAMPEKRLISGELVREGECCAIACVAQKRGIDLTGWELQDIQEGEHHDHLAKQLNVAVCLVREIEYENDDCFAKTPEQRWTWVRKWVERHIEAESGVSVS